MTTPGGLEKMKIYAYEDSKHTTEDPAPFPVLINPASYTHTFRINYTDTQAQGSNGGSSDFNKICPEEVSFELVFDATGVVSDALPEGSSARKEGLTEQLKTFREKVFNYNGKIHSPNYLKLAWGTFLFNCRLSSVKIDYTLFTPDGKPLRARADCSFIGYDDQTELALKARKSSPDLTHVVTVRDGDTLPLLCQRIYGSSAYYLQVARANGLSDFRRLVPGTQLLFPPFSQAPA
jgi:LysM repeat protein